MYIGVSKIQKKVRHVVFNGHQFALKRGVDFIKHAYTPQQANYIITEAQKVADGIIKMVYDDKFPKGYIGQSLVRNA